MVRFNRAEDAALRVFYHFEKKSKLRYCLYKSLSFN